MTPRPRAAAVLACLALSALVVPWQLAALAGAAVLAAIVVDSVVARRSLESVDRDAPRAVARGRPFAVRLTSTSSAPTVVKQPQTAVLRVSPREAQGDLEASVVALARGAHALPAPAARSFGPLGLAGWTAAAGVESTIDVYPDLPGARRLVRGARGGRLGAEGRRRGPTGLGTEFESIREYHSDDDVRRINWRATERLGRPMTNQFRVERDRDVVCVVDCGRLVAAPIGHATRLDLAVDAVLAVAAVADELGDRSGLVAFDDELRRVVRPRRMGAKAVLGALVDLEPRPVESDYLRAFASVGGSKRAFVLIFTDVIEESAARPLELALPLLARRHAVTIASVVDEGLRATLVTPPRVARDAYRQVAAVDVDHARARAVARLRGAGADIVEAPAASFAWSCVQSYLRAKSRARL